MDIGRLMFWRKRDTWKPEDSRLYQHAKLELEMAGLLEDEGLYGDMLGKAVLELVEVFARQGHSGMSASITLDVFNRVAGFGVLTPLTFESDEWVRHSTDTWQHKRKSSVFTADQGKTWYDLDEEPRVYHPIDLPF